MAIVQRGRIQRSDLALWDGRTTDASRPDATGGTLTGTSVGHEVDVLGVFGTSTTSRTRGTIQTAISHIGSANVTLNFAPGNWIIDSSLTIPANFVCRIPAGCTFTVDSGQTLTFLGPVVQDGTTAGAGSGTIIGLDGEGMRRGYFKLTGAESVAGVTPKNYMYAPGDIRRYGAVPGGTDCYTALANACAQASATASPRGAPVYIPRAQSGWYISAGVTVTGTPFTIYGDDAYYSYLYTDQDITPITVVDVQQNIGCIFQDFAIIGLHATPTSSGVRNANSSYTQFRGMQISGFYKGIFFDQTATQPLSSFLCSIVDSSIIENDGINIDCEGNTNYLTLRNVTFGSAPIGLKIVDSSGFSIFSGDCEGCTTANIDLDCTSEIRMGAVISGVDFESSGATAGIIRIGNTALVRDVVIMGCGFYSATSAAYIVNTVRANGVSLIGCAANTGTSSGLLVNTNGTTVLNIASMNCPTLFGDGIRIIGGAYKPLNDQSSNNYTLAATDNGKDIRLTNTKTLTIPAEATVSLPIGFECEVHQYSTSGTATVAKAVGVTLYKVGTDFTNANATLTNCARAKLKKQETNAWTIEGQGVS